jgi:hypothetical protein
MGGMGSPGNTPIPPQTGVDPLGDTPDTYQYSGSAWGKSPSMS